MPSAEHTELVQRHRYLFRSHWQVEASPADVYRALENLVDYPRWWPEVRAVRTVDETCSELRVRSLLPYDLAFLTRQSVRDPAARVLEARMTGDLEGFSRWTITPRATGGTDAVFDEDVLAAKALLRRLGAVARPAFRANHALMMRHGQQGLAAYLAGYRRGRQDGSAPSSES